MKTRYLAVVGLAAFTLSFLGVNPLIVIFGFGSITGLGRWVFVQMNKERPTRFSLILLLVTPLLAYVVQTAASTTYATPSSIGLWPIFLIFLKIGSVVFGSGYVLLAFLRGDLVVHCIG